MLAIFAAASAVAVSVPSNCMRVEKSDGGVVTAALETTCYNNPEDSLVLQALAKNASLVRIGSVGESELLWYNANFTLSGCDNPNRAPLRILEIGRVDFEYTEPSAKVSVDSCWQIEYSDSLVFTTPHPPLFAVSSETARNRRYRLTGIAVGSIIVLVAIGIAARLRQERKKITQYGSFTY